VEIRTPATHSFRGEGLHYATGYGVNGGQSGAPGDMNLLDDQGETTPAPKFGLRQTGPVTFKTQSPGGGGYGNPTERDPALVLRDWRDGLISDEALRDVYRVVPTRDGRAVDTSATGQLRKS
jgi:N-methylhydantoinase B